MEFQSTQTEREFVLGKALLRISELHWKDSIAVLAWHMRDARIVSMQWSDPSGVSKSFHVMLDGRWAGDCTDRGDSAGRFRPCR